MRRGSEPVYIKPESVSIGDTINVVSVASLGVTTSKVATIATRDYEGSDTVFFTAEGGEIFRYNSSFKPQRITLLNRADSPQTLLELFR